MLINIIVSIKSMVLFVRLQIDSYWIVIIIKFVIRVVYIDYITNV